MTIPTRHQTALTAASAMTLIATMTTSGSASALPADAHDPGHVAAGTAVHTDGATGHGDIAVRGVTLTSRSSLEARPALTEAAEKKRTKPETEKVAEAEAAAAAEAADEAHDQARKKAETVNARPSAAPGGSPKAIARQLIGDEAQYQCFKWIVDRESGWDVHADNPTSDAYGLVQALPGSKMASAGPDWQNNPATQIKWGLNYMKDRYGSPCDAKAFWQANNWY